MNINTIDVKLLTKMFKYGTAMLVNSKSEIDALNVFPVPDGDTGTNMSLTMTNAVERLGNDELSAVDEVAKRIAKGSLMGARGNSGVILSQIFRGFSKGCEDKTELSVADFTIAFQMASETAYKAVLKPVEGTILTVIREIAESLQEIDDDMTFTEFFERVTSVGNASLDNTPNLLPALKQAGVIDAGGKGLMTVLEGFFEVVKGKIEDDFDYIAATNAAIPSSTSSLVQAHVDTENIKFAYCTEFIVRGNDLIDVPLKSDIIDMGDSMVYVPDDDLIKVHIHTNDPGEVMQKALQYGELIKIKIENMKEQHSTILNEHGKNLLGIQASTLTKNIAADGPKAIGIVAVAMGDGMAAILKDLGVDVVISGGQTMNPSTEDIHLAIDKVNADEIIVFPNNSNIIMAASQAADLCERRVGVVPAKTVLQCITAMLNFNLDANFDENLAALNDAVSDVKSIQVTNAVRDTEMDGINIKDGDFLGILDGGIKCSTSDLTETVIGVIAEGVDEDSEIITIYYGDDVSTADAESIQALIAEKYDDLDVDIQHGGQPVYHYLISIE